jgi:type II secretory pathway pseudopilin PulG
MRKGFSLLESLVGIVVFLFIICGSLEFFGTARRVFFRLRDREESSQAAWAAMEKIQTDVRLAGQGLARPMRLGLVSAWEHDDGKSILIRGGSGPRLTADAAPGQTMLMVSETEESWAGRTVCLFNKTIGETALVLSSGGGILELASPLANGYRAAETSTVVLQKTTLYLDDAQGVLRRKADASPAQPLCEDVDAFEFSFDASSCLAAVRLALASAPEKPYVLKTLARNAALGRRP